MDSIYYLNKFQKAKDGLDKKLLNEKKAEAEAGIWLESVVLRIQKKHWANKPYNRPQTDSSIFFSIWLNEMAENERKIFYNIHALKLRQLIGYSITSRKFASEFREKFKRFEHRWPNVNVDYGPQTLMQGWKTIDVENLQEDILELANKFFEIDFLIDDLLNDCKLPAVKTKTL